MKKALISGLTLFMSVSLFGQKGFLKFQVGYAFPIANEILAANVSQTNNTSSSNPSA
jgi:hypothetical protein